LLIILIGKTLKQYRKVLKVLERNPKPGRLLLVCVLLESFKFFPPNPYYEPLLWFMILQALYNVLLYMTVLLEFIVIEKGTPSEINVVVVLAYLFVLFSYDKKFIANLVQACQLFAV